MTNSYVYIMASKKNGTLYTGVTSDLQHRVAQHMAGTGSKFAAKYGCKRLVWYEAHTDIKRAITREKTIKKWLCQWNINAIEAANPDWGDLRASIL